MKPGTRIKTIGANPEPACIVKPTAREKLGLLPGWHIVRFEQTGGRMMISETGFRVL